MKLASLLRDHSVVLKRNLLLEGPLLHVHGSDNLDFGPLDRLNRLTMHIGKFAEGNHLRQGEARLAETLGMLLCLVVVQRVATVL